MKERIREKTAVSGRKRKLIFINLVIVCIASSMLATALTTALPAVTEDLEISVTTGQWLTSGYSLAMAVIMPLTAFLITRFPTRRLYLSGITVFIAGLVFCIAAPGFPTVMAARILQAVGSGILSSMAQVIILSIYPAEERGTAMGWYGLSIGAAPVIAPTVAGFIVDLFSWRMIFAIAAVIMTAALITAWCVFDDVLETSEKKFDVPSFLISILAFGGITLGVGNIGNYSFFSPQVLPVLLTGAVAAAVFSFRQLHIGQPFLELRILKNRNYFLSVAGSMLLYFVMMGSSVLMPLYAQSVMGYSATVSGLIILPGSAMMAFISPFAGRMYDKLGIKILFAAGSVSMLLSCLGMFFIRTETPVVVAALWNVLRSVSVGFLMMPLVTWGTESIPGDLTAHGTALLTSLRTVAGAVGTAVFVTVMSVVSEKSVRSYGAEASMHGINVAFLCMGGVTVILLLIGIFGVRSGKKERKRQ